MRYITFDTHKHIKDLQDKYHFSEVQAEGIINSIVVSREYDMSQLATKEQLVDLKKDISDFRAELKQDDIELKSELKQDTANLKTELKQDITELKIELKQDVAELKTEIANIKYDILKWIIPMFIGIIASIISVLVKLA